MSTMHTTDSPVLLADSSSAHDVTLARVIRSEWIKLRSVRSTVVTLVLVAAAVAGAGVLVSMLGSGTAIGADNTGIADAAGNSLFGTMMWRSCADADGPDCSQKARGGVPCRRVSRAASHLEQLAPQQHQWAIHAPGC